MGNKENQKKRSSSKSLSCTIEKVASFKTEKISEERKPDLSSAQNFASDEKQEKDLAHAVRNCTDNNAISLSSSPSHSKPDRVARQVSKSLTEGLASRDYNPHQLKLSKVNDRSKVNMDSIVKGPLLSGGSTLYNNCNNAINTIRRNTYMSELSDRANNSSSSSRASTVKNNRQCDSSVSNKIISDTSKYAKCADSLDRPSTALSESTSGLDDGGISSVTFRTLLSGSMMLAEAHTQNTNPKVQSSRNRLEPISRNHQASYLYGDGRSTERHQASDTSDKLSFLKSRNESLPFSDQTVTGNQVETSSSSVASTAGRMRQSQCNIESLQNLYSHPTKLALASGLKYSSSASQSFGLNNAKTNNQQILKPDADLKLRHDDVHSCNQITSHKRDDDSSTALFTLNKMLPSSAALSFNDEPTDLSMKNLKHHHHHEPKHPTGVTKQARTSLSYENVTDQDEPLDLSTKDFNIVPPRGSSLLDERRSSVLDYVNHVEPRPYHIISRDDPCYGSTQGSSTRSSVASAVSSNNTMGYQPAVTFPSSNIMSLPNEIGSLSLAQLSQLLPLAALLPFPSQLPASFPSFPASVLPSFLTKVNDEVRSSFGLSRTAPVLLTDQLAAGNTSSSSSGSGCAPQYQVYSSYGK